MELNDKNNLRPYMRNRKDGANPPNIVHLLSDRQLGYTQKPNRNFKQFAELKATVSEMKETRCQLPSSARSTFLMTFSHDCAKVASTHGDHNIYVSDVKTGKHLHKLEGHPRTPWCIAFHPTSNDILASGCLGGEVRVWDLHGGSEKWKGELDQVIASLAFHPFLPILVIAKGSYLYFWDWTLPGPTAWCCTNSELERVRYVKFVNYGDRIITGISNMNACSSSSGLLNSGSAHHDDSRRAPRRYRDRLRNMEDNEMRSSQASSTNRSPSVSPPRSSLHHRSSRTMVFPRDFTEQIGRIVIQSIDESLADDFSAIRNEPTSPRSSTEQPPTSDLGSNESLPTSSSNFESQVESRTSDYPASDTFENNDQNADGQSVQSVLHADITSICTRIKSICSDLYFQMLRNAPGSNEILTIEEDRIRMEANSLLGVSPRSEFENEELYCILLNMLSDIRKEVASLSHSHDVLHDQINQIHERINEILEKVQYFNRRLPNSHMLKDIIRDAISQLNEEIERLLNADDRLVRNSEDEERFADNLDHERLTTTHSQRSSNTNQTAQSHDLDQPPTSQASTSESSTSQASTSHSFSAYVLEDVTSSSSEHSYSAPHSASEQPSNERQFSWHDTLVALPTVSWNSSSRLSEYFPRHRFNVPVSRNFRRNLTSQFSSNRSRRTNTRRSRRQRSDITLVESAESDDEIFASINIRAIPRNLTVAHRRNIVIRPEEPPSPEPEPGDYFDGFPNVQFDPISDVSSDESDRPTTPPLMMYPPSFTNMLLNGNSRIALGDPLTQNHRIQLWTFTSDGLPPIFDASANIVVRRCMIHNDASVDISQDGEKLVAIIPPDDKEANHNNLMFGVYSLRTEDLGRTLCIWGYVPNAISVSFSPLSQYVVVGSACSRPAFLSSETTAVAQIIKISCASDGTYNASYVRSFTQHVNSENRFQQVSLNCVKWLPQPGLGIAYATNRGCLSICKPTAGEIFESTDESNSGNEENGFEPRIQVFRAFIRRT